MDPELASTVTYGLIVKTMFMEDNLTRLRVIAKEEDTYPASAAQVANLFTGFTVLVIPFKSLSCLGPGYQKDHLLM